MKLRMLGPVEVNVAGCWIAPGPPKQRAVLAALAINAGRTVSMDTLTDTLWMHNPPPSAVKNIQLYVWRLRQLLGDVVFLRPPGYFLAADSIELDVAQFTSLMHLARRARARADPDTAARLLTEAVALWRGPPLADLMAVGLAANLAGPLAAERSQAIHELVELELAAGRADELLERVRAWVADDPLNERLREQQIQVLLEAGRPEDALTAANAAESALAADLGTDPRTGLRALAASARQAMATAAMPKWVPVPRQTPPAIATFAGRQTQIATLIDLLAPRVMSVPVVAIVGPGGIGKSALAVRVAHRMADNFPDGQLYMDLHGTSAGLDAVAANEALSALLRGLGVAAEHLPSAPADMVQLYRSLTAGRTLLVVLDNAADAGQVRPLIPSTGGCAVLITSRHTMTDLDGVAQLHLDPLPTNEATELLATAIGRRRVLAEPYDQLARLIEACGGFPLALRVAGARLASRPSWSLRALNELLRDERGRIAELRSTDLAVRTSFTLSYQHLSEDAQLVFRRCGLVPGPDFAIAAIAVLAGLDVPTVDRLLDELVDASLLQNVSPGRYHLHDLMRIYAAECAFEGDGEPAVSQQLARLAAWYLDAADHADRALLPVRGRFIVQHDVVGLPALPHFDERDQALAWFEAERHNLREVVRVCGQRGLHRIAWQLSAVMKGFLDLRRYTDDWVITHEAALASVRTSDDPYAHARVLNGLGSGYWRQERTAEAADCYQQALTIIRAIGDRRTEAILLTNLGAVRGEARDFVGAIDCLRRALEIRQQVGSELDDSFALNNLGHIYHECERFEEALPLLEQALRLRRAQGNRHGEGITLHCLADTYLGLGQPTEADRAVHQALHICTDQSNRYGEAAALHTLGKIRVVQGRPDEAIGHLRRAIAIFRDVGATRDQTSAEADLLQAGGPLQAGPGGRRSGG